MKQEEYIIKCKSLIEFFDLYILYIYMYLLNFSSLKILMKEGLGKRVTEIFKVILL